MCIATFPYRHIPMFIYVVTSYICNVLTPFFALAHVEIRTVSLRRVKNHSLDDVAMHAEDVEIHY